jgi:predicted component of type VI protein secretion system
VILKLVHTFGKHAGAVQMLDLEVVRFGRAPDGDVVFDPDFDRDASGHHAEARRRGNGWLLVDLTSRNGTFVNGERISERALSPGDEVTFGLHGPRVRFEFNVPAAALPSARHDAGTALSRAAPAAAMSADLRSSHLLPRCKRRCPRSRRRRPRRAQGSASVSGPSRR